LKFEGGHGARAESWQLDEIQAREPMVPGTPYVIPYRLCGERLEIIAVFRISARSRRPRLEV
jgi:hypothetical protein